MQAALLRFRPIMMTTLAALFGALPLALESGTGSELRNPLGITIVGGLLLSPVADALHHAGDLSLHGAAARAPDAGRADRRSRARRVRHGGRRHELLMSPFIRRPIGTTLLAIGLFLVGAVAYRFLPVASLPTVEFPTIYVSASRPGADPTIMAATVAAPLERRLGEISGVTEMTSVSSLGSRASPSSSTSPATSMAPRATCRPRSTPRSTDLPGDLPTLPTFRKANPGCGARS